MERNGDVIAELNRCNTPNYSLLNNSYNSEKYKMCKDDIVTPLFCSASDCLSKSMIMGSEHKSAERYLNSDDEKINLFNTRRDYIANDDFNMPVIESSVDSIQDCCESPIWEKPPILQSFSPIKVENLKLKNSFVNGNKLNIIDSNIDLYKNVSLSNAEESHVSINDINDKLLLDYEAETSSSSSTEELESCPEIKDEQLENNNTLIKTSEVDTNHNIKNSASQDFDKNTDDQPPSPFAPKLPEIKQSISESPTKNDRAMPELIPSLICLDDDDSFTVEKKIEPCEVIDVADSPEMPTLIPFTSERDEIFQVKTEYISEDEIVKQDDTDSCDTAEEILQPQVLLQRLSVNNISKENKSNILSASLVNCYKPMIEGPEIEEIEGVRFFQFRSQIDMEEFNKIPVKIETDEDMIIPTKTMDITQIKGWRTKFFAPESQFHPLDALEFDDMKTEESNQGNKVTANHLNESENKSSDKKELHSEAPTSEAKKSPTPTKFNAEESCEDKNERYDDSSSDSEEDEKKTRFKEIKDEENKNPLSAFVSEELDKYLLNSSTLNISLLQKFNPNIIPIPPDAKILSIGKLRKRDGPPPPPHLIFKRKSDLLKFEKAESDSADPVIVLDDSPVSPNIITLESSDDSDENVPVAKFLKSKRKIPIKREGSKCSKRNLESEYETSAKRVVLRLTKEGNGVSKGYKVSDISCKKDKSASTSRASSPSSSGSSLDLSQDIVEIPTNGSLPIIKRTLFSEKKERRLVNEFLNNLNMYGTRKDVAMLVQSNQSYFDEGPTLTSKVCAKAVSVLVSNKEYFEEKQKSKKKLKTWQKYLPKKIDKQNMKMKFSKRKSRIEKLLNDAESMLPAERGKRSIRLPARYLDSAVLAASEWVSPVITIDDSIPNKNKEETVEDSVKSKVIEENLIELSLPSSKESSSVSSDSSNEDTVNKAPIKLPQKRSIKMKKTLVKKKIKSIPNKVIAKDVKKPVNLTKKSQLNISESSSSDSSDDDHIAKIDNKIDKDVSKKKPPNKRKKSDVISVKNSDLVSNIVEKSLTEDDTIKKRHKSKETCKKMKEHGVALNSSSDLSVKVIDNMDSQKKEKVAPTVLSKTSTEPFYPQVYSMPNCSCKHSARTTLFDYQSKNFTCAFCNSMKKVLFRADSKKTETNSLNVEIEDQEKDEFHPLIISQGEDLIKSHVKMPSEKPEVPDSLDPQKNNLSISDISTSIPISFTNQFLKQDSKIQTVNQNVTTSSGVPSNSVANKYILLLQPVKTVANTNTAPTLPIRHELPMPGKNNPSPLPVNHSPVTTNFQNKSKPPILICKTSTGLIAQNTPSDSSVCNTTTSNLVRKMSENTLPPQISHSFTAFSDTKESPQSISSSNSKLISKSNSSPASPPVVTAYKLGNNLYICKDMSVRSPAEQKTVTTSNVQEKVEGTKYHICSEGPIITSVQSVQPEAKKSEDTSFQNESTESSQNLATLINQQHNYNKPQKQNRRKSPLIPLNYYDDDYDNKAAEDEEVDVETVDDSCNVFKKKRTIKIAESESDISDNECADIFLSSADKLRSVYSKKTIKERQRRLQIKSGFENLKLSSRWFKNAKTCIDILNMAVGVVHAQSKADKMHNLAKKRLKIHNSMLMGKLSRTIEGIEPSSVRNKTKMQIIKALALDQINYQNKKSVLPLLSEGYKGCAFNSDTEKKKFVSKAPDIEIIVENAQDVPPKPLIKEKDQTVTPCVPTEVKQPSRTPSPQLLIAEIKSLEKTQPDDSHSVQDISSDEMENLDLKPTADESKKEDEVILESPKDVSISSSDSSKKKFEGMKQKVKEALEKNEKEDSSDSNTEELDSVNFSGFSEEDFDFKFCGDEAKKNTSNVSVPPAEENAPKSSPKEFPGLIPLFHPKVLKENFSPSQSPLPPKIIEEHNRRLLRKNASNANIVTEEIQIDDDDDDDDDEVAILNSPTAPSSTNSKWSKPSSSQAAMDLAKATKTANELFGPCTVQKLHLANGRTVFAYDLEKKTPPEGESSTSGANSVSPNKSPALNSNPNGIRSLSDVFNVIKKRRRTYRKKRVITPEEIILTDSSDDDTRPQNNSKPLRTYEGSSSNKTSAPTEKNDDEQKQGDKNDSSSSSL